MLIVHVIVDLTPGGAELMLKRLVGSHAGGASYRHRVLSLRSKGSVGPQIEALGVTVEALGLGGIASMPRALFRLTRRIASLDPDVVQCWMYHADLLGGLAARLAGVRKILWGVRATHIPAGVGTSPVTTWIRWACARLSRRVPTRIVYVAEAARRVHEALGYDPDKSIVIPNGFAISGSKADEGARDRLRRELALPPGALLIGTAGRFNPLKDYRAFVRAGAVLARSFPDVHFLMIGRGLDRANAELGRWIAESGAPERFHLLGERPDLAPYLAGLDIFCLHSIGEGFPNVVGEAMAQRIPCVVTDVGDAALLLGEAGIVVPPSRLDELSAALASLIEAGPDERQRLGRLGFERVKACFSLAAVARQYEQLYEALACSPTPGRHATKAPPAAGCLSDPGRSS